MYAPVISRILGELGLCLGLCTWPISAPFALRTTEACLLAARLSLWCGSPSPTSPPARCSLPVRTLARAAPPPHHHHPAIHASHFHSNKTRTSATQGFSANFQPFGIPTFSSHYAHLNSLYPRPPFFAPFTHNRRALLTLLTLVDPSPFASLNRHPHFVFDDLLMHQ